VPSPPTNIHHALKRQRKLLSPADVPRLWALPRIAAELVVALADRAVCEERAWGGRPTLGPSPDSAARAAPRGAPAPEATADGAAANASGPAVAAPATPYGAGPCTGALEAGDAEALSGGAPPRAGAEAPATSAPGVGVMERERRGASGGSAAAEDAAAQPAAAAAPPDAPDSAGEAGAARAPAGAGAPAPEDAADARDASQGTGAAPSRRARADAGASSADPEPAGMGPPAGGGPGVAAQLAHLAAGNVSASDVAAADALALEVRRCSSSGQVCIWVLEQEPADVHVQKETRGTRGVSGASASAALGCGTLRLRLCSALGRPRHCAVSGKIALLCCMPIG